MLDGARKLLLDEYYGNREIVAVFPHFSAYSDEKERHHLPVFGAGDFIIRPEPWFSGRGGGVVGLAGKGGGRYRESRFYGIRERFLRAQRPVDHRVWGGGKLRKIPLYRAVRRKLTGKQPG